MRIIVDAMGGDNAPFEIVKGCALAVNEFDIDITLVGDENAIKKVASENEISLERMNIVHTDVALAMDDDPLSMRKADNKSSMAVGFRLLANNEGDAFLSCGNSGAMVAGATFIVKRLKGVRRVAFAPVIPSLTGNLMLIDSGANNDCTPDMLCQFGVMGSAYMKNVMNVENPRVGLANVGTEAHKGRDIQREAYELLQNENVNFIGNVEGRDIPEGKCDVVVADGFSGNLILKTYEGVAMVLMNKIKGIFNKNIKNKLAAAMVLSDMKQMKKEFDYNATGGAPVLGCSKPVFKAHGSAVAKTVKNAIGLTVSYVNKDVVGKISAAVAAEKSDNK